MSTENSQRESAGAVALLTENLHVLREISWELNALGWALPGMAPVGGDTDNTPFRVRAVAARVVQLSEILMQAMDRPEKSVRDEAVAALLVEGGNDA